MELSQHGSADRPCGAGDSAATFAGSARSGPRNGGRLRSIPAHPAPSVPVPSPGRCPMSINFVTAMAVKSFDVPDKKRCPDKAEFDLCTVNDYSVARLILGPGWRWSENTRPYERTDVCQHHHLGFCISGDDGSRNGRRAALHDPRQRHLRDSAGPRRMGGGPGTVRGRGIPGRGVLRARGGRGAHARI